MALMSQTDDWDKDEQNWSSLMKRSQSGDKAAYEQLLSELSKVIERYIKAKFGLLIMLEDCVQECLLALHNARHTYDPKRPFRPWMFTIVQHKTIDVLRRNESSRKQNESLDEQTETLASVLENVDRLIDGQRLMDSLAEEQRQAVALTKYMGMTTEEAAEMVGINHSAMKARLRRGLKNIQKQLNAGWAES